MNGNAFKRAHTFCVHILLGFYRTVAIMINKYALKVGNINIVVIVKCSAAHCTLYFVICGDVVTHFSDSILQLSPKKVGPGKIARNEDSTNDNAMEVIWKYASCEFPRNVN